MIDFAWFDLVLLAIIAARYAIRPYRTGMLHDPVSLTAASFLGADVLGGGAALGAAEAAPAIASTVLPEVAVSAAAPELALGGALGGGAAATDLAVGAGLGAGTAGLGAAGLAGGFGAAPAAGSSIVAPDTGAFGVTGAEGAVGPLGQQGAISGPTPLLNSQATTATGPTATSVGAMPTTGAGGGPTGTGGGFLGTGQQVTGATDFGGGPATDAAAAKTPATTSGSFLGNLGTKALNTIENNPLQTLGVAVGGGSLLANIMQGNQPVPGQAQLQNLAGEQASQGRTLAGYATSGTLPPGQQAQLDLQTNAKKAAIRSSFASAGYSNSSAEVQALAQADQEALAQRQAMADQLLKQGFQYTGLADNATQSIMNTQLKQEADLQAAIARFAGSLAGSKAAA